MADSDSWVTSASTSLLPSRQQQRSYTMLAASSGNPPTPTPPAPVPLRPSSDLSYMHRPPTIMPNYGKKARQTSVLPKSNVSRVLLYDNLTQQSMLGVRLSSLKSQSYKTNRELEMHMKSFISRRRAREKALANITHVHHDDDYSDFLSREGSEDRMFHSNGPGFLPNILPRVRRKPQTVPAKAERIVHNRHDQRRRLSKSHDVKRPRPAQQRHVMEKSETQTSFKSNDSLPQITASTPPVTNVNGGGTGGSFPNRSRIGYRFVKSSRGVTQIFHAVTEEEGNGVDGKDIQGEGREKTLENLQQNDSGHLDNTASDKDATATLTVPDGDQKDESNITSTNSATTSVNSHLENVGRTNFNFLRQKQLKKTSVHKMEDEDEKRKREEEASKEENPEKPLKDFRFLHLRNVLVPQDPPNEGFLELSPSFPRKYPSLRGKSLKRRRTRRMRRHRRHHRMNGGEEFDYDSDYSEGETPSLSDVSDSEDDGTKLTDEDESIIYGLKGGHIVKVKSDLSDSKVQSSGQGAQ